MSVVVTEEEEVEGKGVREEMRGWVDSEKDGDSNCNSESEIEHGCAISEHGMGLYQKSRTGRISRQSISECTDARHHKECAMFEFKVPACTKEVERILNSDAMIHFLNTTIIPPGADGTWIVEEVESGYVRHCLLYLGHSGAWGFVQSHIGHEATAQVASELFEQPIAQDRTPWDGSGLGVALQLKGRIPEGKILTRAELEEIGYSIRLVLRLS